MALKKKKEKQKDVEPLREVPFVRYIELVLIIAITILVAFGVRAIYLNDQAYQKTIPILQDVLSEVHETEVDNYLSENADSLLYVCVPSEEKCRNFEKEFKTFIEDNKLQEEITYLDLGETKDIGSFFNKFNETYQGAATVTSYPALVQLKEGKIASVLEAHDEEMLTLASINHFLKTNGIGGTAS